METSPATPTSEPTAENTAPTLEFDPSLSEDERRFYTKAYPTVDLVRERKVHCTVCKCHIGTAPASESNIKMHPILRVTHCVKCHDFYNSGEFSKGEDGSELYCRWCGQGGEVYCCSNCPYVFCKSCIVKNLSRGVVADIEQNENWSCFSCAPKILWPLRAQHWALSNYIDKQKKSIEATNLNESDLKQQMSIDRSTCCRLAKSKLGNMSDSMESLDSIASKRSHASGGSTKKHKLSGAVQSPAPKRPKNSNDVVVCTPDLMSMLEPDCQITVSNKPRVYPSPATSSPKVMSLQPGFGGQQSSTPKSSVPPPLVLRSTNVQMRPITPSPVVRRTIIGSRTPTPGGSTTPVYHTINGYRIDLNTAAQQETFRLPNGKLIQVKRQGTPNSTASTASSWQQQQQQQHRAMTATRPVQITHATPQTHYQAVTIQQAAAQAGHSMSAQQHPQMMRYANNVVGNTTVTPITQNGAQIQLINGTPTAPVQATTMSSATLRPLMVRHVFPDTAIGQARTQLQDQVFNAMEICQHLTGKVQTLTNSNAYKQARNYLEVKELYIHLSYLLTYAIGRFKGLQDKCLADMRQLGFVNDATCLENGQLAAGSDYVNYGQLEDVDLFNTGANSFHNQVYEYRKSLHANLEDDDGEPREPLPPLPPLGVRDENDDADNDDEEDEEGEDINKWTGDNAKVDDDTQDLDENEEADGEGETEANAFLDTYMDDEQQQQDDTEFDNENATGYSDTYSQRGTEDVMHREEQSHAYDRKLTRLIEQYPSIWCTRHPDYGNFEVTRKQWRTIAAHFKRGEQIKLRWKNIRKRFVRIERRMREGKRFNGYFDKATNFLSNRDLPPSEWMRIDRGEGDGDVYERTQLDAVQRTLYPPKRYEKASNGHIKNEVGKPIEIQPLDMKIINFVKCNPVLWRKTSEPANSKTDEQTRKSLWMHLWKSAPRVSCEDIVDRWTYLYEMYKTFRLKTIKNERTMAALELKYSKYLAKLYFLYKIDEEELRNECVKLEDCADVDDDAFESGTKLQDMPDDKEFVLQLVCTVRQYPSLWNVDHIDYHDTILRETLWHEIAQKLEEFKRDVKTIKLRWQLAKFCYNRLQRDRRNFAKNVPLPKYSTNLPVDEMAFVHV